MLPFTSAMQPLDITVPLPSQRRITLEEFVRMGAAGVFGEEERVELLEGVLVVIAPPSPEHSWAIQELTRIITRALPEGYRLRPQLPVVLGAYSMPQPDLAIVDAPDRTFARAHPSTALLAIEVSVTPLDYDRNTKSQVYARAGIAAYWVVDVEARSVEVRLEPDSKRARYRSLSILGDTTLKASAVALPPIPVGSILP